MADLPYFNYFVQLHTEPHLYEVPAELTATQVVAQFAKSASSLAPKANQSTTQHLALWFTADYLTQLKACLNSILYYNYHPEQFTLHLYLIIEQSVTLNMLAPILQHLEQYQLSYTIIDASVPYAYVQQHLRQSQSQHQAAKRFVSPVVAANVMRLLVPAIVQRHNAQVERLIVLDADSLVLHSLQAFNTLQVAPICFSIACDYTLEAYIQAGGYFENDSLELALMSRSQDELYHQAQHCQAFTQQYQTPFYLEPGVVQYYLTDYAAALGNLYQPLLIALDYYRQSNSPQVVADVLTLIGTHCGAHILAEMANYTRSLVGYDLFMGNPQQGVGLAQKSQVKIRQLVLHYKGTKGKSLLPLMVSSNFTHGKQQIDPRAEVQYVSPELNSHASTQGANTSYNNLELPLASFAWQSKFVYDYAQAPSAEVLNFADLVTQRLAARRALTPQRTVHLVLAANVKYLKPLRTCLESIFFSRQDFNRYQFYVLQRGFSDAQMHELRTRVQAENCDIEFIDMRAEFEHYELKLFGHFTLDIYSRLLIPAIFKQRYPEVEQLIYLDCDTLVLGDLADLVEIDLGEYVLAAVPDQPAFISLRMDLVAKPEGRKDAEHYAKFTSFQPQTLIQVQYFNSGMCVWNLRQWRKLGLADDYLLQLAAKKREEIIHPDQDVLNLFAQTHGGFLSLPQGYNNNNFKLASSRLQLFTPNYTLYPQESTLYVQHYLGLVKPWMSPKVRTADWYYFFFALAQQMRLRLASKLDNSEA
ncbi:glycosyltransferase family 8 protein [Psittacicella hinzii]|uniref:Lipopolysaccharide biosynthesis glycosyltransferase n=1 Tax=Psittacicella hinzii TaxID=2028575 RepID=A0A3A1YMB7_9GAMM|nr:glycosyltransferase family 8 protein [Psittacicella hinzii]RIY39312.1 hypothetical protein CKF58_02405 [Psittacicella hinzii]